MCLKRKSISIYVSIINFLLDRLKLYSACWLERWIKLFNSQHAYHMSNVKHGLKISEITKHKDCLHVLYTRYVKKDTLSEELSEFLTGEVVLMLLNVTINMKCIVWKRTLYSVRESHKSGNRAWNQPKYMYQVLRDGLFQQKDKQCKRNKKFYHCSCFFNIFPLKRAWPFTRHPRMLCAKFGWNWPSDSCEEDFQILSMYFCYFVIMTSRKRACPFVWTNLNPHPLRLLCS